LCILILKFRLLLYSKLVVFSIFGYKLKLVGAEKISPNFHQKK